MRNGAEVDDERLRVRPLGGCGVTPLFEELGRSHVGAPVTEAGVVRKEGRLDLPPRTGSRPLRKGKTPLLKGKKPIGIGLEPNPIGLEPIRKGKKPIGIGLEPNPIGCGPLAFLFLGVWVRSRIFIWRSSADGAVIRR